MVTVYVRNDDDDDGRRLKQARLVNAGEARGIALNNMGLRKDERRNDEGKRGREGFNSSEHVFGIGVHPCWDRLLLLRSTESENALSSVDEPKERS